MGTPTPQGPLFIGLYRFQAAEPVDPEFRCELRRHRQRAAKYALLALLVATTPFWIIGGVESGLLSNDDFPSWTGWPVLLAFLGALVAAARAGGWHRVAAERCKTTALWRFELLDAARDEIAAQRALGRIPSSVRIAERLWVLPARRPMLARIEGDLVRRPMPVPLTDMEPAVTSELEGLLYVDSRS
ncbi:MAG: hypothetical protein IPJ41_02185 [Phycisphaerales bacterium]|nr:hypothetical protein [Phycisphaerales bacterium]